MVGVLAAITLYAVWALATWLLEARIEILLRPDAADDRVIYAIIANLLIGVITALIVLRHLIHKGILTKLDAGFGIATPSPIRLAMAVGLGFAFYLLQGAPSLDPPVLTNAYAQVLVVSAAEVIVCWAVVAAAVEQWDEVADALRAKHPKVGELMDAAREDVLACMDFPKEHWPQIASTTPLERLNREIKRRADVIGIFPNDDAIVRLVGALMLEASHECAVSRRYMSLETLARIDHTGDVRLPTVATRNCRPSWRTWTSSQSMLTSMPTEWLSSAIVPMDPAL